MKLKDLRRGMRCTNREGDIYIVDYIQHEWEGIDITGTIGFIGESKNGFCAVSGMDDDLTNGHDEVDIMIVEDITVDGFKVIWERQDKKYYLKVPNSYLHGKYLNYNRTEGNWCFGYPSEDSRFKTKFTKDEIDNLPHQDFIKSLIMEEV